MTSSTIKERVARWIDRSAWRVFQVLTSAALLALAAFVVAGEVDSQRALVALALLAVVAALAALRPSDLRELVGRLSEAGPLKFATGEAETAAAQSLGAEADEQGFEETMLDLRLKLEYKLAYIAKHLLGKVGDDGPISGGANYVTIGSLQFDGLLSREQGRTAAHILTWTDEDLSRAAPHAAAALLSAANELVSGIRATVFANLARMRLEESGFEITEAEPTNKRRRDLLAQKRGGGPSIRIVPVFATSQPSSVLDSVKVRLDQQFRQDSESYIVVIPDHSATNTSQTPPVVHLRDLVSFIERLLRSD